MSRANLPAIPETAYYDGQPTHMIGGLTIRERFAMAAMQGILSNAFENMPTHPVAVAPMAVSHADALLAELAKPIEQPLDENGRPVKSRHEQLVAAVNELLPEIDSEIDQRKTGGNDEDWLDLLRLVENVREALP